MTRPLDPGLVTAISQPATEPHSLLHIAFNEGNNTLYLSSYGDETVDSQAYKGGLSKPRLRVKQGQFNGVFAANNTEAAVSTLLVVFGSHGHQIEYYAYYPGHSKVLLARGIMDGARWDRTRATLNTRLTVGHAGRLPKLAMIPPMFNWFPAPGEQFVWGQTTYTTEL